MSGFQIHNRIFGPELWTDPFIAQNYMRREVLRAVIHLADGYGKFYNSSDLDVRIKIMFFPIDRDINEEHITVVLSELKERGILCEYTADGENFMHLPKWGRYQQISPSRRGKSVIPNCPDCGPAFGRHASTDDDDDDSAEETDQEPEPKAKPKSSTYAPSPEAVNCVTAWRQHDEVSAPNNLDLYHRVFDRMHTKDKLSWEDIHAICRHALEVWLPDGITVSPTRLRKPSAKTPDMKLWQVILKQSQARNNAVGRKGKTERVDFDADGLDKVMAV